MTQDEFDALDSEVGAPQSSDTQQSTDIATLMSGLTVLQGEIASLTSRIDALEASDSTQAAQIQALQGELAASQERVTAIEVLPTVQKLLEKMAAEAAAGTTQ